MGLAPLMIDPVGVLRGPEHDEDDELLLDVVEPMRHVGTDEDDRAALDRPILVADRDPASAGGHVVDLILGVGLLRIAAAGREDVQADREVVGPHELVVEPIGPAEGLEQVRQLECVHRRRG